MYIRSVYSLVKVSVRNLTKIFGKKSQQAQALKMVEDQHSKNEILEKTGATVGVYDASFDVHEGEIFVIMGLSGSGKSTLIRLLNRLIEPTSGTIYLDDENISAMKGEELRKVFVVDYFGFVLLFFFYRLLDYSLFMFS